MLLIIDAYPFGPNLRAHQKSTGEKGDIRKDRIIKGRLSFLPSFGEQAGGLDALYYYAPTQTRMQVAQETANNIPCDPCIDASRSSSLYQDNLTEIKVNALFGLNLIKAF